MDEVNQQNLNNKHAFYFWFSVATIVLWAIFFFPIGFLGDSGKDSALTLEKVYGFYPITIILAWALKNKWFRYVAYLHFIIIVLLIILFSVS